MEKRKRWQLYLILAVIILTIYNILPTVFYYTKPLKAPIGDQKAAAIEKSIATRVGAMSDEAQDWIGAFCKHLGLKPASIKTVAEDSRLIEVTFTDPSNAEMFKKYLPRAGALIPFTPAGLALSGETGADELKTVLVERQVGSYLNPAQTKNYFQFATKKTATDEPTPFYQKLVYERAEQLALGFGGTSSAAQELSMAAASSSQKERTDIVAALSRKVVEMDRTFGATSPVAKRTFASYGRSASAKGEEASQLFIFELQRAKQDLSSRRAVLVEEQKTLAASGHFLDSNKLQELKRLEGQQQSLEGATSITQKYPELFKSPEEPLTIASIKANLEKSAAALSSTSKFQTLSLGNRNPFISELAIDWSSDLITLKLHSDITALKEQEGSGELDARQKDELDQLIINEIARVAQVADETIVPGASEFIVNLNTLTNSQSILALDLGHVAEQYTSDVKGRIVNFWKPKHSDLQANVFPIWDYATYQKLTPEQQKLGLVIYAPALSGEAPLVGFRSDAIYVIAKGINSILQKYQSAPNAEGGQQFIDDFKSLGRLLQNQGFLGYSGAEYGLGRQFGKDFIFEHNNYYAPLLKSTREDFAVHGSKQYAVLEFTDVEQRILTQNRIDTLIHEDLMKWRDEYNAAQVRISSGAQYEVPPPTKSVFLNNLGLSAIKYFRGDNRKILHWGMDLSGGKTVLIGLRDGNRVVTNETDLKEGVNQLTERVNKMGVSEVGIRTEGTNIVLDFPGSQGLSASELIRASSMTFHVVNERFGRSNSNLAGAVNQFLQDIWNEAVVTNRKDIQSINAIAWQHLGGNSETEDFSSPKSDTAQLLLDNGLRLAGPWAPAASNAFNDTLSSIAMLRGTDFVQWEGQTHPLLVTFRNPALEGSNLSEVSAAYSPSEGNFLSFAVRSAFSDKEGRRVDPREDFYNWTSQYSQEKIAGTEKEHFSNGRGWRMAVILNGSIITAPTLNSALRDRAQITGSFSQREVNQLVADLKAGSLSFTPQILSEQNISPDLGHEERTHGILAAFVGLILVCVVMIGYYRFAGLVASVAVLFNLLVMWGVLQNISAALTLPGIAGIVLTVGMAVDANVLVFERIREEFAISKRIASAIQTGYRKAFSAIFDSNITTIMAALILMHYGTGPIKGFAVTLIIGIVSSMFTALFMTRYFFAGWVQNPEHKELKMARFLVNPSFNFLNKMRPVLLASLVVLIAGGVLLVNQRQTIFGMDFTGGFAITVDLQEKSNTEAGAGVDYRAAVTKALIARGAKNGDFQVQELNTPNKLRLQFGVSMEQPGHPFHDLIAADGTQHVNYGYEKNPHIVWLVAALSDAGLDIQPSYLANLDKNWVEMSGQLSDTMRNDALVALGLALLCILIYITFRFELKYAISATLGLIYVVLITLASVAILHKLGIPLQLDLQAVAAIMTIIGYSLNDTIIVFDRIREDTRLLRKIEYSQIITHALNATLSRTIMTSGTTFVVLLALVCLGGSAIFGFSLIMALGVIIGTYSSLFVAAPILLMLHDRSIAKDHAPAKLKKA